MRHATKDGDSLYVLPQGIDLKNGAERFLGNQELYLHFLKQFTTDESYGKFLEAMKAGHFEQARIHIHALKGMSANLSITSLHMICTEIDAQLICDASLVDMDRIHKVYREVQAAILSL